MGRKCLFSGLFFGVYALIVALILPAAALSAVYYVDPATGNDTNPGTNIAAPWAHIPGDPSGGRFPVTINGGDTIYVKSGATFNLTGQLLIDATHYNNNATASTPILIKRLSGWGSGNVVFNGAKASLGQFAALIWINRVNYVTLDGVTSQGFDVRNSPNRGFEADGLSESSLMVGLTVRNMRIFSAASYSFYLHTQGNFYIYNVECDGNSVANNGGFYTGDNTFGCNHGIYQNCVAHNIGNAPGTQSGGTDVNIGFWTTNSYNIAYINCTAYLITGRGFDTGVVGSPPSQMADNILFLNCVGTESFAGFGASLADLASAGDGHTQGRQYYVNCLSYNNYANGAWVYQGVTAYFYNCVLALNAQVGIYSFANSSGDNSPQRPTKMYFADTIFYQNNTSAATGEGNCDLLIGNPSINGNPVVPMYYGDYNLFDQGAGSEGMITYNYLAPIAPNSSTSYFYYSQSAPNLLTWQSFSGGFDTHSGDSVYKGWHADFTNASGYTFTLAAGSSAIGTGLNLAHSPPSWAPDNVFANMKSTWGISPVDFNGSPRPATANWDMGAYNHTSTCTYAVSPTSQSFPASGGTGKVSVTTQSGCAWTASGGAGWITITSGASGTGSGTVAYTAAANTTGSSRTADMTVAGQTVVVTEAAQSHTITANASPGGSISPSGSVVVDAGASQTFTITPASRYAIASVVVDGRPVGAVSSYTFDSVASNHTITALFRFSGSR